MPKPWRGIFAIVTSPFDEMSAFLWEDFQRECDWVVRAGSHGLVWPVMASEFTVISRRERVQGMKLAVDAVAGRIPVVIGVADTSKDGTIDLAKEAAKAGADSIIAMPPWATKMVGEDLYRDYYRSLAEAAGVPVMIQNCSPPLGSALSGKFVVELCKEIPLVQYLKEEKRPQGPSITEVIELAGPEVKGVFSGAGAKYIMAEYQRGVCGNMPACTIADIDSQIWDALEAGDEAKAREIMEAKAVFENAMMGMPGRRARKEVLVRRGVLSTPYSRNEVGVALDAYDTAELEYALSKIEPYFTV